LRQDLKHHPAKYTLAYCLFSSGAKHGNNPEVKPLWEELYPANVEVVLNGHDRDYERFGSARPIGKT
jgi:hypothetical protein